MSPDAYSAYLRSPEWAKRRDEAIARVGGRCQGCSSTDRLEAHHLTYERVGHERPTDLMVLCDLCHSHEHGQEPRGVAPIAGPTTSDITTRVREREALEGEQRRVIATIRLARIESIIDEWERELTDAGVSDRAARRDLSKLRWAVGRIVGRLTVPPDRVE